jgi:hypothetical protein
MVDRLIIGNCFVVRVVFLNGSLRAVKLHFSPTENGRRREVERCRLLHVRFVAVFLQVPLRCRHAVGDDLRRAVELTDDLEALLRRTTRSRLHSVSRPCRANLGRPILLIGGEGRIQSEPAVSRRIGANKEPGTNPKPFIARKWEPSFANGPF